MTSQRPAPDVLVVGGGLGGVAAALAAARLGSSVVLTEESPWLGGQVTSQGVPPDENRHIETVGAGRSYQAYRDVVRTLYREGLAGELTAGAAGAEHLNPGTATVSRIAHEPKMSVAALDRMLAPYEAKGTLTIHRGWQPTSATVDGDRVTSVQFVDSAGSRHDVTAAMVLDATEDGLLLELTGCEYLLGSESQDETGEPHALTGPTDPYDQQAITWCLAVEHRPGESHVIDRPTEYPFWRDFTPTFWTGPLLSFTGCAPPTREPILWPLFRPEDEWSLWTYRRIRDRRHFSDGGPDISLVNWPQHDYFAGPVVGVPEDVRQRHLTGARQLTLSFLYWLQTEAPRDDGGTGFPELKPATDVFDTPDGLALRPYLREGRRIVARTTVLEQDIAYDVRPEGPRLFDDTVGIGSYRIDLHPSTGMRNYVDFAAHPFQVPLGALVPVRLQNLVPAAKNIGTTHITNGCYRLHPVEWTIGEAAGALAAVCARRHRSPEQIHATPELLSEFQTLLTDTLGARLSWPDHVLAESRQLEIAKQQRKNS